MGHDGSLVFCTIGKAAYRWPLRSNAQDLEVYEALQARLEYRRMYLVVQARDGRRRVAHHARVVGIYLPRISGLPVIDHIAFIAFAWGVGLRLRGRGVRFYQAAEPTGAGLAAVLIKWMTGIPYLLHVQGDLFTWPPGTGSRLRRIVMRRMTQFACRYAKRVRCVSRAVMRSAINAGVLQEKLVLVPSRCDVELFRRERHRDAAQRIRRDLGAGDNPVVTFVGTFSVHKGLTFLLAAFHLVKRSHPEALLFLVGSGGLEPQLRALVRRLGLDSNVRFCGRVGYTEVAAYLGASNAFVLSSVDEGMPRVVLEASAMEVPVVATAVGGVPELIEHHRTGLLVPPADAKALAEAIRYVLDHPQETQAWASRARAVVVEQYSFDRGIEAYAALLRMMAALNHSPASGSGQA